MHGCINSPCLAVNTEGLRSGAVRAKRSSPPRRAFCRAARRLRSTRWPPRRTSRAARSTCTSRRWSSSSRTRTAGMLAASEIDRSVSTSGDARARCRVACAIAPRRGRTRRSRSGGDSFASPWSYRLDRPQQPRVRGHRRAAWVASAIEPLRLAEGATRPARGGAHGLARLGSDDRASRHMRSRIEPLRSASSRWRAARSWTQ